MSARLADTTFRSLRIRNFRLWFGGQLISMAGTFTQMVAQQWLVLDLSHNSPVAVSTVTTMQFVPTLVFGLWGGLLADRLDKRKLLIGTQAAMATVALGLATVTIAGIVELWMVYLAAFLTGLATFPDTPARQAFMSELVGEEDLGNAVSLNSATFNGARVVGPSIAGVVLVTAGAGACFLVNAVSYLAVLGALWVMRAGELHRQAPIPKAKGQLREGLSYAWNHPTLRTHLLMTLVLGSFGFSFQVVMPVLARVTFHSGAGTFSKLMVLQGLGALAGTFVLASRPVTGRVVATAGIAFAIALVVAGSAPSLGLAFAAMPAIGFTFIMTFAGSNALVQMVSAPAFRGRVIGVRSLLVLGLTPIGSMIAGFLGEAFSPRVALIAAGCAVGCAVIASTPGLLRDNASVNHADEIADEEVMVAVA